MANNIILIEDFITPNLNFLLNRFNLKSIESNFNRNYPNITQEVVSS